MSVVRPVWHLVERFGDPGMTPSERITLHAVRRYIERVMQLPLRQLFRDLGIGIPENDAEFLHALDAAGIINTRALAAEIFERVRPGLETRAATVLIGRFVFVISPAGRVTTVMEHERRRDMRVCGRRRHKTGPRRIVDEDVEDVRAYGARFAERMHA